MSIKNLFIFVNIKKIFWSNKKETGRLMLICFFLFSLLIGQELFMQKFDSKNSLFFYWQKKWHYNEAIENGIKFYTTDNWEKLRIDDYFLLKKISAEKNLKADIIDEKYSSDPFRRLLDKSNPMAGLNFARNKIGFVEKNIINNSFYDISGAPKEFFVDPTDDVVLKALYCDLSGYDDADFGTLKLLNRNDGSYLDTHFLLSLLFLKNNHCYDEQKIDEQIQIAVEKIVEAEKADVQFSDLYAERIVFLYWAGYGNLVEKEWVDKIKNSQRDNFSWHDSNGMASDAHVTGLAILAMIYYAEGHDLQEFY